MGKRKCTYKTKKRSFTGNIHTRRNDKLVEEPRVPPKPSSASARKVRSNLSECDSDINNVNIIFDVNLLFGELQEHLRCVCGGCIRIRIDKCVGLGCKVCVLCQECGKIIYFNNCPKLGVKKHVYSINRQVIYAMRCIGQGLAGLKVFCGIMNLPSPVKDQTYSMVNSHILSATSAVSKESSRKAAIEEVSLCGSRDISVSCDGTWLTRGHSSLHGVCTVIGIQSGKVIDTEVLSLNCKSCEMWKGRKSTPEYLERKEMHGNECNINHSGTSGNMEVEGMKKIFLRSVELHNVRYIDYIGDGDTKSFKAVSALQPYGPDVEIKKSECIGHVQKRMGTHLRAVKQEYKGKILSDGKPLSGRNRLTDNVINTLTTYYGNAVRENCMSVDAMRKSIWAIWYHKASTDKNPMHYFCPKDSDTWCPYQKAVRNNTVKEYHHKNNIPPAVMEAIKPVFKKLVTTELLARCVGGHTQNNNESLNAKIWKICPKTGFAGRKTIQIAVNDATMTFNEGMQARIRVMKKLGLTPGKYSQQALQEFDDKRVRSATKRALESTKEARKCRKKLRLAESTRKSAEEGRVYASGQF